MPFKLPSVRLTNGLIVVASVLLIIIALVMQEVYGLHPCPLCVTQRLFVVAVGFVALVACVHNPSGTGRRLYAGAGILAALAGLGVAARHVWIQNLPEDQVPACGPGLEYMFETFPLTQALELLFMGDGNCADVVWTFLGLSIPGWMLVFFCGFIVANFWQLCRRS